MMAVAAAPVVYLLGMGGLGDNIYQRPLVKAQVSEAVTYLSTPWPELYADVPGLRFVAPWNMALRTQQKNIRRVPAEVWAPGVPRHDSNRTFWYSLSSRFTPPGIMGELEMRSGISLAGRWSFDLPDFGPSPVAADRPIAVLRPVTTRKEWQNNARAPRPEYVARAAQLLRAAGFYVVAVADIAPPFEWLEGEMPDADLHLVEGELDTRGLLALIQNAAVVVGGVGFIVPAAIAAGTPAVFLGGGMGGQNAPELVMDPRMDTERVRWVLPDAYCRCRNRSHDCGKAITDFPARFRAALDEAVG